MPKVKKVRAKWEEFLYKIEERYMDTLDQAEQGCLMMLDMAALDTNPMTNAWMGINAQLSKLVDKIEDVWDDKVEEKFEDAYEDEGLDDSDVDDEYKIAEKLEEKLEQEKLKRELKIFGEAARKLMESGKAELEKTFNCTQCKAPLPIKKDIFRSYFVTCEFCNRVNTFDPGTKIRNVEAFCSHNLAKEYSVDAELTMLIKEEEVREARSASYDLLKSYEETTLDYWTMFFEKRAEIVPAYGKDLEKDIDARMRSFYIDMNREDNWKPEGKKNIFNQDKIRKHIRKIGKSIAKAGDFPEEIYTHFYAVYSEVEIKNWLSNLWDEEIEATVHERYKDDLAMYRQLVPTPKTELYEGFLDEMREDYTILNR